jgi:hypothetical protein
MDKLQTRPVVWEGAPQEGNHKCLKIFSIEVNEKLVADPGWWPDTRIDWPNDRQS